MYTLKIMAPVKGGRYIQTRIETYADLDAAHRVAQLRASVAMTFVVVLSGERVLAHYGLGA